MIDAGVVREALEGLVSGDWDREDCALENAWAQSAEDAGFSPNPWSFVVRLPGGQKFLVSVQPVHE